VAIEKNMLPSTVRYRYYLLRYR